MPKNTLNEAFNIKSITHVVALCMLSFGLYVIFRLYQLSKRANDKVNVPISNGFMGTAIVIHLLSFASLITFFIIDTSPLLLLSLKALHVISSFYHFIWILKVKNRMNEISGAKKNDNLWIKTFLSTFFHMIYMQYKINKYDDKTLELPQDSDAMGARI